MTGMQGRCLAQSAGQRTSRSLSGAAERGDAAADDGCGGAPISAFHRALSTVEAPAAAPDEEVLSEAWLAIMPGPEI